MNLDYRHYFERLFLILLGLSTTNNLEAKPRRWVLTLPVVAIARESNLEFDLNLGNDTSLAFTWARTMLGEDLSEKELLLKPNSSLSTQGHEFMALFQRFSKGSELSGFHWGLGAGYKTLSATWVRVAEVDRSMGLNDRSIEALNSRQFKMNGVSFAGRLGYRYVASDLGFTLGAYLKLRHFNSKIDQKKELNSEIESTINKHDQIWVKRRMMTSLLPGLELGWAF